MTLKYTCYASVKDKLCISYYGHCEEYPILLSILRPYLTKHFNGLDFYLCVRDSFLSLLEKEPNIISQSQLLNQRNEFGYVKEIEAGLNSIHPILAMLDESNIPVPNVVNYTEPPTNKLCCVFSESMLPTKPMSTNQIEQAKYQAKFDGYEVWVNPSISAIDEAGWIIGVEGINILTAAMKSKKVSLVPTGCGARLYKSMFSNINIFKNN